MKVSTRTGEGLSSLMMWFSENHIPKKRHNFIKRT